MLTHAIAAMKADHAQLKEEIKTANADRKAKLQKKIAELETSIEKKQAKAKERRVFSWARSPPSSAS